MSSHSFDIVIVGAGPAGCTAALFLADSGLSIALIDRANFPRDIVCGDALGGQVITILKRMPGGVYNRFLAHVPKTPVGGIRIFSPRYEALELPYPENPASPDEPNGYICSRRTFDNFLLSEVKRTGSIQVHEGIQVTGIEKGKDHVMIHTGELQIQSKIVLGADGVNSVVRRSMGMPDTGRAYSAMAIRGYYQGVTGFHPNSFIDLYFLDELLPEYFWIFPETAGVVNAGMGMKSRKIIMEKVSLKAFFTQITIGNPHISGRFADALPVSELSARELAISKSINHIAGDCFFLLGDAARLVDPFLGEGIGNAMASGEAIAMALKEGLSHPEKIVNLGKAYTERIRRRIGPEHKTGRLLHYLAGYPGLFNAIAANAVRNKKLRDFLVNALADDSVRKKLKNPWMYVRMLLNSGV